MSKTLGIMIVIAVLVGGIFLTLGGWAISQNNREVALRKTIENKMTANTADFDNMKKIIMQTAQVSEKEAETLRSLIVGYADARGPSATGSGTATMVDINAVQEAVPSITSIKTLQNLQNIVVAERNKWTNRQKELVDYKREHDTLLAKFPGVILFSILGRGEIQITIVTSTATKQAFETGEDNDNNLFN